MGGSAWLLGEMRRGCSQEEGKGGCRRREAKAWEFEGHEEGLPRWILAGRMGDRRMGLGCQVKKGEEISLGIKVRVREKMDYISSDNEFWVCG